ncbi:MAG: thioesterase family protein [Myxococcales bacterium]|nr:thioesterase family protein [Myxococcales bacterium]
MECQLAWTRELGHVTYDRLRQLNDPWHPLRAENSNRPMYVFDEDTQLTLRDEHVWTCAMSDRWNVGTVPNGGYVMSIASRALSALLPHPDILSLSGHYLLPARPGATELHGERIRVGGSASMGMLRLVQDGQERARFLATAGHFDEDGGVEDRHGCGPPAAIPALEACHRVPHKPTGSSSIASLLDTYHAPAASKWLRGEGPGEMISGGYIGFSDGREPDVTAFPLFCDAFPPTVFNALCQAAWVPTLQLNVQFRARPNPGLMRALFRTRHLTGGLHEEDGELWDSQGTLTALSRQLARIRLPKRDQRPG